MTDKLIGINEMSEVLGVPKSWLYEQTRRGTEAIPFIKVGRYIRFDADEVLDFYREKGGLPRRERRKEVLLEANDNAEALDGAGQQKAEQQNGDPVARLVDLLADALYSRLCEKKSSISF